jgi:O-antigen/teichoic acid export membrane protein
MLKLLRSHPLGQLTWLFASFTFGAFFNYLFHAVSGRLLGAEAYGVVAAFIGLQLTLASPFSVMQTLVADFTIQHLVADQAGRIKRAGRQLWAAAGASFLPIMAVVLLARPWLGDVLGTSAPGMLAALGLVLTASIANPIGYGFLQGAKSYGWMGAIRIAAGVLRFALALALIAAGVGLGGAIAGVTASSVAIVLLLIAVIERLYRGVPASRDGGLGEVFQRFGFFALAALTGAVLVNSDVILARWLFAPEVAGQYSAAATIGNILLFFIIPLNIYLFPSLNERHLRGDAASASLALPAAFVMLAGGVFWLACTLAPRLLIRVMYGPGYLAAGSWLGLYAFSRVGLALSALYNTLYIARHRWGYVALKGAAALALLALMAGAFPTPEGFLAVLAGVSWGLVIAGEALFGGIIPRSAAERERLWRHAGAAWFVASHPRVWAGLIARARLVVAGQAALQEAGLPGLMASLDGAAVGDLPLDHALRLDDLVAAALSLPGLRYCMRRSILYYVSLRGQGGRPQFVVGVERRDQDMLAGHSWIELNGEAFREEDDQHKRMVIMFSHLPGAGAPPAPADRL